MVAGNYAENAKRELYNQMIEDGVAQKIDNGKRPEDPENWKRYELRPGAAQSLGPRGRGTGVSQAATNVDAGPSGPLKTFARAVNIGATSTAHRRRRSLGQHRGDHH